MTKTGYDLPPLRLYPRLREDDKGQVKPRPICNQSKDITKQADTPDMDKQGDPDEQNGKIQHW